MKGLRSPFIALFLAGFLLMPMGAMGLVLCIGADGHIAFEPARHSRGTTPIAPTLTLAQQPTPLPSQLNHYSPCVDVPLLTSAADSQQFVPALPLLLQLEVPGFTLVPGVVSASPELPLTPFWLSLPRVINTTLSALRTVILLL